MENNSVHLVSAGFQNRGHVDIEERRLRNPTRILSQCINRLTEPNSDKREEDDPEGPEGKETRPSSNGAVVMHNEEVDPVADPHTAAAQEVRNLVATRGDAVPILNVTRRLARAGFTGATQEWVETQFLP